MASNYAAIIQANIHRLFTLDPAERAGAMGARHEAGVIAFQAFGTDCRIGPDEITLNAAPEEGPRGIIISLYALHAVSDACLVEPLQSFKEVPDSAPYAGAFANRTEQALVPTVGSLSSRKDAIYEALDGRDAPGPVSGDVTFIVHPLPKIALCYVCYLPDEEFPAAVTCLYSRNAHLFLPTDALADVGEYTTRALIDIAA